MSDTERTALWLAIEDYSGLWEVVWELRAKDPARDEGELRGVALTAVRALLNSRLVDLYRCEEPYGELFKMSLPDAQEVLADSRSWDEPAKHAISIRIGATPVGEEVYATA
jgi:hypothetical protein